MSTAANIAIIATLAVAACATVRLEDLSAPRPVPLGSCLVIGFLGGRDAWNDASKGVRRTALELRDEDARIFAETFENRRRDTALRFVLDALDHHGDERVAGNGVEAPTLVVYGQSLGGSAVVKFARQLDEVGLAIQLTVQIDSVGRDDGIIPPNVRHALNLYQDSGTFLKGEHPIEAEDPECTRVLGNWRFDYDEPPGTDIPIGDLPFWKVIFRVAHAKMDRDPRVWDSVRTMLAGACAGHDLPALATRVHAALE